MMENAVLYHVPVGTVLQSDGTPPHFFHHVHAFLDRKLPGCWKGKGDPDIVYHKKAYNVNHLHDSVPSSGDET